LFAQASLSSGRGRCLDGAALVHFSLCGFGFLLHPWFPSIQSFLFTSCPGVAFFLGRDCSRQMRFLGFRSCLGEGCTGGGPLYSRSFFFLLCYFFSFKRAGVRPPRGRSLPFGEVSFFFPSVFSFPFCLFSMSPVEAFLFYFVAGGAPYPEAGLPSCVVHRCCFFFSLRWFLVSNFFPSCRYTVILEPFPNGTFLRHSPPPPVFFSPRFFFLLRFSKFLWVFFFSV